MKNQAKVERTISKYLNEKHAKLKKALHASKNKKTTHYKTTEITFLFFF